MSVSSAEVISDPERSSSGGNGTNLFCLFAGVAAGVLGAVFFSPVSVIAATAAVGVLAAVMVTNNKKKNDRLTEKAKSSTIKGPAILNQPPEEAAVENNGPRLVADNIPDPVIKEKTDKINNLVDGLMKTGNRTTQAKVKFFYLPETQKTLELYHKLAENGIDTPNSKECMDIISENLDKTIKLLTMEYDKAVSDSLLDMRMSQGVIGKMLDNAVNEEQNKIVLK